MGLFRGHLNDIILLASATFLPCGSASLNYSTVGTTASGRYSSTSESTTQTALNTMNPLVRGVRRQSSACPSSNLARSIARGYWFTSWAKMRCSHTFEEEMIEIVVSDVSHQPTQCDVTYYRPPGDLRVRIVPSTGAVVAAWMRPPESRGWRNIDRSVCLLSSMSGAMPWLDPVAPDLVQFAYNSIVAVRQRAQLMRRMCGQSLSLVATEGLNGVVELSEQRLERVFFVEVLEGAVTTVIPVKVRVEEAQRINPKTNLTEVSYRFLSSSPSACQISSRMPFAAFGCAAASIGPRAGLPGRSRRLQELNIVEEIGIGTWNNSCSSRLEGPTLEEFHDMAEAQNSRAEWRAEVGNFVSVHQNLGAANFSGAFLGDRTPDIVATDISFERRAEATRQFTHAASRELAGRGTRLPRKYDFRRQFPTCSRPARPMGHCSAAWAFAAVGGFEKQLCRLSNGSIAVALSPQRLLDCASSGHGCVGGSVFDAYAAMLAAGSVVPESCYSFVDGWRPARTPLDMERRACLPLDGTCRRHFSARYPSLAETPYQTRLSSTVPGAAAANVLLGELAMQSAILLYGAVTASFAVYPEFLTYREGVYRARQTDARTRLGTHVVQLVGWGVVNETKDKYWIAENSWGNTWGENQDFERCSVVDCRGPLCPAADNYNADCADSPVWRDAFGSSCEWYKAYDPGCKAYPDSGQVTQCRRACQNCLPPSTRSGEECGFFRILRGSNHLGIEAFATHTYVAGYAPPERLFADLAAKCEDDATWRDPWGASCSWYGKSDAGCIKFQDYGQRAFCRRTCATCPVDLAQSQQLASQVDKLSRSGSSLVTCHMLVYILLMACDHVSPLFAGT